MNDSHAFLRYLNARSKLVLRPSLLLLGPFLASMPLFIPNARIIRDLSGNAAGVDSLVLAMAAACLVLSVVLGLYAVKKPRWAGFGGAALCAAAVVYVLSQAALWVLLLAERDFGAAIVCLGVVLGVSSMPLVMAWMGRYAMDVRNVMLYGALSCISASLLAWGLSLLPAVPAAILFVLCAVAGGLAPLVTGDRRSTGQGREARGLEVAALSDAPSGAGVVGFGDSLRNLLSVIWLPLLGFLVCIFVSASCEFSLDGATLRSEFIGGAIAAVIAIAVCLMPHKTPFVLLVEKLVIPVFVAVSIILGGFPAGSSPFYLGASVIFSPMMFLSLFALASLVAIAAAGEFSLPFVFGAAFFSGNLVTLLGLAAGGGIASSDAMGPVVWVMICGYFAVVIINLGYSSWRQLFRLGDEEDAASSVEVDPELLEAYRHQQIDALAVERGLTNRERELLEYLSRGYGSSFIAKTLFISDNTARTHIRNIYRKLGVSSREELLSIFNDGSRADEGLLSR